MYKLIAIDLDGTLLNEEKTISRKNIKVLRRLIDLNYEIVIATGRRYWSAKELIKVIGKDMTVLANNGSVIRDTENDQTLATRYLKDYREILEFGESKNLYPVIHVDSYYEGYDFIIQKDKCHKAYNNYIAIEENRYKKIENISELDKENILAIVYVGAMNDMEAFHLEIDKNYSGRFTTHVVGNIQVAEAIVEVLDPKACKWLSLLDYAKGKGIDSSEIIAIGDDNNDFHMIRESGLGIAMKNANPNVKKVADIVTKKDNDESGLAYELEKILCKGEII